MFYGLRDENELISQKYSPNIQVKTTDLWADFEPTSPVTDKYRICPLCGGAVSQFLWGAIKTGKLNNKHFPDIIFLGGDDLIVSERFKCEFGEKNLKGITCFEEIEILGSYRPPFKYYNTQIAYSNVSWDFCTWTKHRVEQHSGCLMCGETIEYANGLIFNENCEYDIFQLYNLPHTYWVSERMAQWIVELKFTNVLPVPANKFCVC